MHKKLEAELIHLAHRILKTNKDTNFSELRDLARNVYENLSVITFIDEYFVETPEVTDSKSEFLSRFRDIENKATVNKKAETPIVKETPKAEEKSYLVEDELAVKGVKDETDKLVEQTIKTIKSEAKEVASKVHETPKDNLEKKSAFDTEMKDSIPADVAADLFKKLADEYKEKTKANSLSASSKSEVEIEGKPEPEIKKSNALSASSKSEVEVGEKSEKQPIKKVNIATKQSVYKKAKTEIRTASLNDRISNDKIQVGLNDRIAFVKHLFNFSQEDFNSVLSQLNSLKTHQESIDFIQNTVKLNHDWTNKEEYEARLMELIERKFK